MFRLNISVPSPHAGNPITIYRLAADSDLDRIWWIDHVHKVQSAASSCWSSSGVNAIVHSMAVLCICR